MPKLETTKEKRAEWYEGAEYGDYATDDQLMALCRDVAALKAALRLLEEGGGLEGCWKNDATGGEAECEKGKPECGPCAARELLREGE